MKDVRVTWIDRRLATKVVVVSRAHTDVERAFEVESFECVPACCGSINDITNPCDSSYLV